MSGDEVEAFRTFAAEVLTTETGAPFILEPFQLEIVEDILGPDPRRRSRS